LNALDAAERGATILTRSTVVSARREDGAWTIAVRQTGGRPVQFFRARCIINAAGPWVSDVIGQVFGSNSSRNVRLVKGSHIIVPKFWQGANAYLVQNFDKRVIFINPYEGDKALIGTTDIPYQGRAEDVAVDDTEIDYLIAAVNRYFKQKLQRPDVLHSYAGVRPLFDDGKGNPSAVTRDYVFDLDETAGVPLLNVFGGKITTFRELAERAMHKLDKVFPQMGKDWTRTGVLPGGEMPDADYDGFVDQLRRNYTWVPVALLHHYARRYGARTKDILRDATSVSGLGQRFSDVFYEAEVTYLVEREWAQTPEDILRRRTKHGLHMSDAEIATFNTWFSQRNFGHAA
jgi:D-erythritol 1-phosphate dehydrogenase